MFTPRHWLYHWLGHWLLPAMRRVLLTGLALGGCIVALTSCDPLAPDPATVAAAPTVTPLPRLLVAPTETLTPTLTRTPSPTPTLTRTPTLAPTQTLTPSITPTLYICTETTGQLVDLEAPSKIAGQNIPYRVYLPPCYASSGKRYPSVLLLHGSDRDQTQWTDLLEINKVLEKGMSLGALPPMILIMPYGGALANSNVNWSGDSWEDVLLQDVLPEIERNFCTWNERAGRAISGISRGGFWSFSIGFRHPDLFSVIAGHSAFVDADFIEAPFNKRFNPVIMAETITFTPATLPRMWLDVGAEDFARDAIEQFKDKLIARGFDPGFTLYDKGDHNIDYWKLHTPEYLSFYGEKWPRNAAELPSCLT